MILYKILTVVLFLFFSSAAIQSVNAQQADRLFEIREAAHSSEIKSGSEYVAHHVIHLNRPLNLVETGLLQVELPNRKTEEFEIIRISEFMDGFTSVTARIPGRIDRFISFTASDTGELFGKLEIHDENLSYHIRYDRTTGNHLLSKVDKSQLDVLACTIDDELDEQLRITASHASNKHPGKKNVQHSAEPLMAPLNNIRPHQSDADGSTIIDLLIPYTPAAAEWAENNTGGINLLIAQVMNNSQLALDNSEVMVELRVAHAFEVDYTEDGSGNEVSAGDHLRRLSAAPFYNPFGSQYNGYMNEVHTLREEYGGDLVASIMSEPNTGGIAWLGGMDFDRRWGFSVNRVEQLFSSYTFIHEIGHNLGIHHSRNQNISSAGIFGGIFEYATGWRFEGEFFLQTYATVMTYAQSSERVPVFSNPDVIWGVEPAGSYSGQHAPADAARAIRNSAPIIAGFYPSKVDAPQVSGDFNLVSMDLDREVTATVPLSITNSGDSELFITPMLLPSAQSSGSSAFDTNWYNRHVNPVSSISLEDESIKWGSFFKSDENFTAGTHHVQNDWPVYGRQNNDFYEVVTDNSAYGDQYIRVGHQPHRASNHFSGVESSYGGYFAPGAYRFNAMLRFNEQDQSTYYVQLLDPKLEVVQEESFSWLIFDNNGNIFYVSGFDVDGSWITSFTGHQWQPGDFKQLEIIYTPESDEVHFLYDGQHLASTAPLGAQKPVMARIIRSNSGSQSSLDLDAVFLEQLYTGFEYVSISDDYKAIAPGETGTINLYFNTKDIQPGSYFADLKIYTNDSDNRVITMPIELDVSTQVSIPQEDIPMLASLDQNYPNPFNPVTNITYHMPESGMVTISVYNVAGQLVQSLVNGEVSAGAHTVSFNAENLASGLYIYRLQSEYGIFTRKMMLLK